MTTPKPASGSEVVAVLVVTLVCFVVGMRLLDADPTLAPVIAWGSVVLLTCLLTFFASRPF